MLDTPIVGMEHFYRHQVFDADADVQQVLAFLNARPNRVVWSQAQDQPAGLNSDASKHGDFDNDPATLKFLQALIQSIDPAL